MISPDGRPKILAPSRPNIGIERSYAGKLIRLIAEMQVSLRWWITAAYRKNEPEVIALAQDAEFWKPDVVRVVTDPGYSSFPLAIVDFSDGHFFAEDASPARALMDVLRQLAARWQKRVDELAPDLAKWFATAAKNRSDGALRASLKRAGLTVKFHTTRAVNDVLQASIGENVSLIKSIASEHLTQVEGLVMRSVQRGADLADLTQELEKRYLLTRRRAEFIARDQNNKATAIIARVRQEELGITEAIWIHSAGGQEPRPTHVQAGRDHARFNVHKGWYDPHEKRYIQPGELINCRCVSRPVLPAAR